MRVNRFVNGKSYMQALAKALLTAQEEVFIGGWWISPEIMLIRPSEDETFRLDILLGKIAVCLCFPLTSLVGFFKYRRMPVSVCT